MADNVILNPGAGGATVRTVDIASVQYPTSLVTLTDGLVDQGFVGKDNPMPIRDYQTVAGAITYDTEASVSAGGQATLDSAQISSSKTGKLMGLLVASSVAFKAVVQTVSDGVPSTTKAIWFSFTGGWDYKPPSRDFITVAHSAAAGLDGFRVVVTNLDTTRAADVYAVFYYDEE